MFVLTTSQQVTLGVAYKDKAGNPAVVDGAPAWSISNPELAEIIASDDGFSATVRALGGIGSVQVAVAADADLGEGIKQLIATLDIDIVAGEAVVAAISTGTAEEQPVADPAPVDPAPVDPAPTDPAPVDPAPTDPPADPAV